MGRGFVLQPISTRAPWTTGYVTEVGRSEPQVDRRWTAVGPAQKWAEVCYFRPTSGTGLGSAKCDGERSGPEVGSLLIRYYVQTRSSFITGSICSIYYLCYVILVLHMRKFPSLLPLRSGRCVHPAAKKEPRVDV